MERKNFRGSKPRRKMPWHREILKARPTVSAGPPYWPPNSASKRCRNPDQPPYRIMVDLFRTQEQVYRAMALFQQSGERTPVSSGICSLLSLGKQHAIRALENNSLTTENSAIHESLQQQIMEWLEIVQEFQQDWDCRQQAS